MATTTKRKWLSIARDCSGTALVEFAYSLPILLAIGTGAIETTNYAQSKMRVSELALHLADHSSRMGISNLLVNAPVTEGDVNDVLLGTDLQAGSLDLKNNGRLILSSLQRNSQGGQWIAWQRCYGNSKWKSAYGSEGTGKTGTGFKGMGPTGSKIQAQPGEAVMYAEVVYEYKPLFPAFEKLEIVNEFREEAAFNVRDDRDLTALYPSAGSPNRKC